MAFLVKEAILWQNHFVVGGRLVWTVINFFMNRYLETGLYKHQASYLFLQFLNCSDSDMLI
jgi:hypothetical protein